MLLEKLAFLLRYQCKPGRSLKPRMRNIIGFEVLDPPVHNHRWEWRSMRVALQPKLRSYYTPPLGLASIIITARLRNYPPEGTGRHLRNAQTVLGEVEGFRFHHSLC